MISNWYDSKVMTVINNEIFTQIRDDISAVRGFL